MSGNVQWDARLGGTEDLPQSIHLLGHAAARSAELAQMHAHLSASARNYGAKLAFQRIPHHMRRRAMSHNVRRLPRRLRDIHAAQMRKSRNGRNDTDLQAQMRRPSRKYRRRPANLIAEYTRRRTNTHWMHTHVWHAKRFHMEPRWGWKMPIRPTARACRANYRAVAKHCLIQDISFFSCVQLEGLQENIVVGLEQMSDGADMCAGTTNLTAASVAKGNREGTIHMRDVNTRQAVGMVPYLWRPADAGDGRRALWLWIHPAFYTQAMSNLQQVFLNKLPISDFSQQDDCVPIDVNDVAISSLRHELGRFRVRGPLATCVLQRALRSPHRQQDRWWEELRTSTAHCCSPRSVYELLVTDPRLHYPRKRTKATVNVLASDTGSDEAALPIVKIEKVDAQTIPASLQASSGLWDPSFRQQISSNRETNASLANRRTQLLVPGSTPHSLPASQRVPIVLVQAAGSVATGFASGWDLILPAAYAQAAWLALVLWGGRAGGARDSEHMRLEAPDAPHHQCDRLHPDTCAGRADQRRRSAALEQRHWAKPPNRRCNFATLAIVSPFRALWQVLLLDWLAAAAADGGGRCEVSVLRDERSIRIIAGALRSSPKLKINKIGRAPRTLYSGTESTSSPSSLLPLHHLLNDVNCMQPKLVHVRLTLLGRGRCNSNALICLPQPTDDWSNPQAIEEPLHSDGRNKEARKKLRFEHRARLRLERRKRKAAKLVHGNKAMDGELCVDEYQNAMRALWIPSDVPSVRNSCARQVIGWTTEAAFSFVCGRCVALGYLVLPAVPHLLQHHTPTQVLVRDTQSRYYRFAQMQILLS